jgi:hypothetical protein
MVMHQHRVDRRGRRSSPPVLPKDQWRGQTFVESNGTELQVVWSGHRDGPTLCGDLDQNRTDQLHRLRLAGERA